MINLYEKLGILPTATTHQIQNAMRKAASNQSLTLEELQKCKEWLLNPEMREKYTAKLKMEQPYFLNSQPKHQKKNSKVKINNKAMNQMKKENINYGILL